MKHIILAALLFAPVISLAQEVDHEGDVTEIRVIRRVVQHPDAWRVWQPFIIQGQKKRHLIVAFGAMTNGKKDMGDIFVSLSKDDGDTWEEPVVVFDHNQRQGAIQFAYANPVPKIEPCSVVTYIIKVCTSKANAVLLI